MLPDIHLEVSILCTIVRETDIDNYKNLERVIKYVQENIGLPFTLSIEKYGNMKWNVDALFPVNKDTRSHTGGFVNMVTVGDYFQSRKRKMNTKRSTEAYLVGLEEVLTQVSGPNTS